MCAKLKGYELAEADVVIAPEVGDLHWSEFSQALTLVEAGERAAIQQVRRERPPIKIAVRSPPT
jgi:hypothetical protein